MEMKDHAAFKAYSKLKIKVKGLKIDSYKASDPRVQVRLGHKVYKRVANPPNGTSKTTKDSWNNTTFIVDDISLFQHLFWTIQIDVNDNRFLRSNFHVGRCELRLSRLAKMTSKIEGCFGVGGAGSGSGSGDLLPIIQGSLITQEESASEWDTLSNLQSQTSMNGQPVKYLSWFPLRDKLHCYANLTDLSLPDRQNTAAPPVGQILLEISYRPHHHDSESSSPQISPEDLNCMQRYWDVITYLKDGGANSKSHLSERELFLQQSSRLSPSPSSDSIVSEAAAEASTAALTAAEVSEASSNPPSDDEDEDILFSNDLESDFVKNELDPTTGASEAHQAIQTQTPPSPTNSSRILIPKKESNSGMVKKLASWFLPEDDNNVFIRVRSLLVGFGQGIELGSVALTLGYMFARKLHRSLPVPFSNNLILRKDDLEVPRLIYRYAYASNGWKALYYFGKRNEIMSDVVNSQANQEAVTEYLQLQPGDLLVCDMDQDRLFRPNFYVALDRRLGAVILAVRGTMSLRDSMTDLACEYVTWRGGLAHSGMLDCAHWFMEHIGRQLILFAEEYQVPNVIVTGHSLGGSTAALTTIMLWESLRQQEQDGLGWPTLQNGEKIKLHCYSYGTPAILSPDLASKYDHLIDNFILSNDIVPRLSYGSVLDLQMLIVWAAENGSASDLFWGKDRKKSAGKNAKKKDSEVVTDVWDRMEECRKRIQSQRSGVCNVKLHIPGRIHHIVRLRCPKSRRKYTLIDTCGPDRFKEVILRRNMINDHMPSSYEQAFEDAYLTCLEYEMGEEGASADGAGSCASDPNRRMEEDILRVINNINSNVRDNSKK